VHVVFPSYSPSFTLSLYPSPTHWYKPSRQELLCLPVLHFCEKNDIFVCLRQLYREFLSDIFKYYNPKWFIPSIFLLSMLVPLLW
jgi:hypothetical protein